MTHSSYLTPYNFYFSETATLHFFFSAAASSISLHMFKLHKKAASCFLILVCATNLFPWKIRIQSYHSFPHPLPCLIFFNLINLELLAKFTFNVRIMIITNTVHNWTMHFIMHTFPSLEDFVPGINEILLGFLCIYH